MPQKILHYNYKLLIINIYLFQKNITQNNMKIICFVSFCRE